MRLEEERRETENRLEAEREAWEQERGTLLAKLENERRQWEVRLMEATEKKPMQIRRDV